MSFGDTIITWYHDNKRDLPWRHTNDPYKIWLSEVILQQTRVAQGLDYYKKFISRFPDVKKLAAASEDEVLKLWQGLGYYSRARNMHAAAKDIVKRFNGKFPDDYNDILSLKGIGDYTAAAVASFAFHKKHAVVDGNVFRVLSRYLGIHAPVNTPAAKKESASAALALMDNFPPAEYNQAIMEFGALQCKPANPLCISCPLKDSCYAYEKNKTAELPVRNIRQKPRNRYFNYLFIRHGKKLHLKQRTGNDIWKNLYDFPLIETSKKITSAKLTEHPEWKKYFSGKKIKVVSETATIKHQLTHQTIHAKFFEVVSPAPVRAGGAKAVSRLQASRLAVPRLIENYLQQYFR